MADPKNIFFLGKGGTGKSTMSAITSVLLSLEQKKTLLASFDFAHNQSDIFKMTLTDKPHKINDNLTILQVDRNREIDSYVQDTIKTVKNTYSYLTAFNLENYFNVLKYSPGMEEYALNRAFLKIKKKFSHYHYLIFDMPPTAVALRFFTQPALSLSWINQLEQLRREIYNKKEIISKIKFGKKEIETDRVLLKIQDIKQTYTDLKLIFEDKARSNVYTVFNNDVLSVNETKRIMKDLENFNIQLTGLVCNNRQGPDMGSFNFNDMPFNRDHITFLPFSETPLVGEQAVKNFINTHNITFEMPLT